jgi:aspartyl-tRNA(Asn)/glutamyl-tRNA(Gln) amidotransferase subunit A
VSLLSSAWSGTTPRLSGALLRSVLAAARTEAGRRLLTGRLREEMGITAARALPGAARMEMPLHALPLRARAHGDRPSAGLPLPDPGALPTAQRFADAYAAQRVTPLEMVEAAFREARRLATHTPSMSVFSAFAEETAFADAAASAERWAAGAPLSPLDGVPVPIKEELDLTGIGYRLGTSYIPPSDAAADCTAADRLRKAGAILLGHTAMTEIGFDPLGVNPARDMPRNAHDPDRVAGGSSTGSAVAVATGLAPVALGSDAGGSIRVPAAYNGVFGIKPTFGRVSRQGGGVGGTMTHIGPLGASTRDLALFLEAVAGVDPADPLTHGTPDLAPGALLDALSRGVAGLRIGVLETEVAAAPAAVARPVRAALRALEKEGATLVPVDLPLATHGPALGIVTVGVEFVASLQEARRTHAKHLSPSTLLNCLVVEGFPGDDYVDVQSLRQALRHQTADRLREVDVLALPTTGLPVPIQEHELRMGIVDTTAVKEACHHAFLANLTGLPAGTAPVGWDTQGLPVGLQIVGDAFDEAAVLQVLAHLERQGVAQTRRSHAAVSVLP